MVTLNAHCSWKVLLTEIRCCQLLREELLDFETSASILCPPASFNKEAGLPKEGNVQQSLAITNRTLCNSSPHCSDSP